eukprot:226709-Pyramimonas_sp.AAC.1
MGSRSPTPTTPSATMGGSSPRETGPTRSSLSGLAATSSTGAPGLFTAAARAGAETNTAEESIATNK